MDVIINNLKQELEEKKEEERPKHYNTIEKKRKRKKTKIKNLNLHIYIMNNIYNIHVNIALKK